ncbi:unnamed protein product [Caenorhabditis nigoni]
MLPSVLENEEEKKHWDEETGGNAKKEEEEDVTPSSVFSHFLCDSKKGQLGKERKTREQNSFGKERLGKPLEDKPN